jgi:hypothetical protein
MMITDDLQVVADLKLYIKEHYKLVSFSGLLPIVGRILPPPRMKPGRRGFSPRAESIRGKSFGEVTDLMSGYIKENRDYVDFPLSLDKLREEKGLSPAELYKAAWVDKRLFSKIMTTANYRPSKCTAIAFGFALRLNPDEFVSFIRNAGFALSDSSIFDLVIRFCVEREIYDLHDVNALLLQEDQKTLAKEAA